MTKITQSDVIDNQGGKNINDQVIEIIYVYIKEHNKLGKADNGRQQRGLRKIQWNSVCFKFTKSLN